MAQSAQCSGEMLFDKAQTAKGTVKVKRNSARRGDPRHSYVLGALFVAILLLIASPAVAQKRVYLPSGTSKPFDVTRHSVPVNELIGGGPPKDGIPALDAPKFVSAEEAKKFLSDKDRVLGVAISGGAKAYPIRILNWHEIVNDEINGHPITVTW